jgi:hypothetical protein
MLQNQQITQREVEIPQTYSQPMPFRHLCMPMLLQLLFYCFSKYLTAELSKKTEANDILGIKNIYPLEYFKM